MSAAETATEVDRAIGVLLRMVDPAEDGTAYALVVPAVAVRHVLEIHPEVRARLGIEVHGVDDRGRVRRHR